MHCFLSHSARTRSGKMAVQGEGSGFLVGDRVYSSVTISLENCIIPDEKLSTTPSLLDGLDLETETDLRAIGCELIQSAGILLKLPQVGQDDSLVMISPSSPVAPFSLSPSRRNVCSFYFRRVVVGRHGERASSLSSLFLFQVLREAQHGGEFVLSLCVCEGVFVRYGSPVRARCAPQTVVVKWRR